MFPPPSVISSRRLSRLASLFTSLPHSSSTSTGSEGCPVLLPCRKQVPSFPAGSRFPLLGYLSNSLGLVRASNCHRTPFLSITCRVGGPEVPLLFYNTFGGSLSLNSTGHGATESNVSWVLRGRRAREVSQILQVEGGRKQKLLEAIAGWPSEKEAQNEALAHLKSLRQCLTERYFLTGEVQTWRDLTELFDTRGQVLCDRTTRHFRLKVSHPNAALLSSISRFLAREYSLEPRDTPGKIYGSRKREGGGYRLFWCCNKVDLTARISGRILEEGLFLRRRRVEAALRMMKGGSFGLLPTATNRVKYQRLDSESLGLSLFIRRFSDRLRRKRAGLKGCSAHLSGMEDALLEIKRLREAQWKRHRYIKVRLDIRELLRKTSRLRQT